MAEPNSLRGPDDFRSYRAETIQGNVVSFDSKWYLYTNHGVFIRELSEHESAALNEELKNWALPSGEDR